MAIVRLQRPVIVLASPTREEAAPTADSTTAPAAASGPSAPTTSPGIKYVVSASFLVVAAYVAALIVSAKVWDKGPLDGRKLITDVSIFALLYVAAQAVERLLEPVSWLALKIDDAKKTRDTAFAAYQTSGKSDAGTTAANAQASLEHARSNRAVVYWALATGVGMFAAAALKLYFLHILGVTDAPRWAEILVTGLVIGGGTKPLHDLISRIEKAKENTQDPQGTGGD
jgi:hypothetical protein